jgi:hypothetical protein
MQSKPSKRNILLGLAHLGAKKLDWEDEFRREQQQRFTGKSSCKDMTDADLLKWCWHLKGLGAEIGIPYAAPRGGKQWDRPTASQLTEIEKLALDFGWTDLLDDARLLLFIQKTTRVDNVRFLTRKQASHVITGLRRWQKQIQSKS